MARRTRISARKHARKFQKARKKSRAINSTSVVMRGGIRL